LKTGFQIRDNSVRRCPEIEFGAPGVTEKIERKGEKEVVRSSKGRVRGGSSGENPIISESGQAFAGGMNGRVRGNIEGEEVNSNYTSADLFSQRSFPKR